MLRAPLLVLFACLALLVTAYDASAQPKQAGTTEESAKSAKDAKPKPAGVSKKEAAKKAPDKSGAAGDAKKSSKKQEAQGSAKSKPSKTKDTTKDSKKRKDKKISRDPASLPVTHEEFAETPHSTLAALSDIPVDGDISSFFGVRRLSAKTKRTRMHTGIDIMAGRGTPVVAAASGEVSFVGRWSSYGRIVEIDHGNGLVTRYAHLDKYTIEKGAKVVSGEQIGTVGSSGRATGAHLHFETLVNGRMVDPMIAEVWQQAPERLAAKSGTYVSGLRSDSESVYYR
jgi:murein DD-endopeptidase MepM/ murein hydrolase activator NlpD